MNDVETQDSDEEREEPVYGINVFRIGKSAVEDFKFQVLINKIIDNVIADTGAKVSI